MYNGTYSQHLKLKHSAHVPVDVLARLSVGITGFQLTL